MPPRSPAMPASPAALNLELLQADSPTSRIASLQARPLASSRARWASRMETAMFSPLRTFPLLLALGSAGFCEERMTVDNVDQCDQLPGAFKDSCKTSFQNGWKVYIYRAPETVGIHYLVPPKKLVPSSTPTAAGPNQTSPDAAQLQAEQVTRAKDLKIKELDANSNARNATSNDRNAASYERISYAVVVSVGLAVVWSIVSLVAITK